MGIASGTGNGNTKKYDPGSVVGVQHSEMCRILQLGKVITVTVSYLC